jgi:integrase
MKRNYGEGSLYLRGRVWWISYSVRGKARWESTGTAKRSEAVKVLQSRLTAQREGRANSATAERVTFADLREMLQTSFELKSNRSWPRARQAWAHLDKAFGETRALDIDYRAVEQYAAERKREGAALGTIGYEVAVLRRAFSVAVRAQALPFRPAFPTFKVDNARQGFFEQEEFERVLAELPQHLRPVATFAYWTGWRGRSEILSLTWEQVDFAAGEVRCDAAKSKGKESRVFPFGAVPELVEVLRGQKRSLPLSEWVFHRNGQPIRDYYAGWRAACTRAKLPGRLMHDFRRTAVRNLERAGVSRDVARRLTGHKTDSVYARYNIVNTRDLSEAAERLAAHHASAAQVRAQSKP